MVLSLFTLSQQIFTKLWKLSVLTDQEEFQVTELEMIPQTEVTLEGEDLEVFEGLIDALEADDDVQKVYHNVADM